MQVAVANSGSSGNATFVTSASHALLIDCGLSLRVLQERAAELSFDLARLNAILVTHEHGDHVSGVAALARQYRIPVYTTRGTRLGAAKRLADVPELIEFSPHASFAIGDLDITPIPVTHDAREPCQFVVAQGRARFGLLTDLGSITPHVVAQYRGINVLMLEFNHDLDLLAKSGYPARLRKRVAGAYGHLSNQQAVEFLGRVAGDELQHIVAAHISERSNLPELVRAELASAASAVDATWDLAQQHAVLPWLDVAAAAELATVA